MIAAAIAIRAQAQSRHHQRKIDASVP